MILGIDDLPARLRDLLTPEPNTGCWLYVGGRFTSNGYPRVFWEGKERVLHRVVWGLLRHPVPPELQLDHGCRVITCSCPFSHNGTCHEPVTPRENTRRGNAVLFGAVPCLS